MREDIKDAAFFGCGMFCGVFGAGAAILCVVKLGYLMFGG
jgi:hypothetical protein